MKPRPRPHPVGSKVTPDLNHGAPLVYRGSCRYFCCLCDGLDGSMHCCYSSLGRWSEFLEECFLCCTQADRSRARASNGCQALIPPRMWCCSQSQKSSVQTKMIRLHVQVHCHVSTGMHAWVQPCMHGYIHACMHGYIHACMHTVHALYDNTTVNVQIFVVTIFRGLNFCGNLLFMGKSSLP